ncbi:MAG: WD40 repeat domain-containing protein, partial [Actinomycetota bacterium]
LEGSAEDAYAALSNVGRATCRKLFEQLVQLGDNALPTRRTRQLGDLIGHPPGAAGAATATGQWPELDQVIDTFVGKRLLTLDVDTITISHESLLGAWPRLAEWVDQLRHQLSVLRRIAVSAATWVELDRNPDALLVGSLLDDADALILAAGAPRLSDDELAYVDASRAARAERRRRDQEVLSRQLAMQSTMLRDVDAALAARISMIAHQQAPTATTRSALIASTSPLPGGRYLGDPGPTVVAVADDAPVVAVTNSARGTVAIMTVDEADRAHLTRRIELAVTSPNADAYAVALSPDGTVLAVGGTDRQVTLVDLTHPTLDDLDADRVLTGPEVIPAPHLTHPAVTVLADDRSQFTGAVHALTFGAGGSTLYASGVANGVARWLIRRDGDDLVTHLDAVIGPAGTLYGVAVGGDLVACAHLDGSVTLCATDSGAELWRDDGSPDVAAGAICVTPNDRVLLAGYRDGDIRAWRIDAGAATPALTELTSTGPTFSSWVNSIAVSPSGRYVVAASSDGRAVVREIRTSEQVGVDLRHPTVVTAARFLDDTTLTTTAEDGTLRTWRIDEPTSDATIWANDLDATGRWTATASGAEVVVRHDNDVTALTAPAELTLSGAMSLSEDGTLLIAGTRQGSVLLSERTIEGVEWATWRELAGLQELVEYTALSGDGRVLGAVDRDGVMQLWVRRPDGSVEAAARDEVQPPAVGIDISGDGALVAVSSESSHVTLYDIGSSERANPWHPQQIAAFATGESFALCVAFHPSQPVLAVGNADRSVSLWRIESAGEPSLIARLTGPGGHPMAITWDAIGRRLAAGTTDGVAWVWNVRDVRAPIEFARIAAGSPVYAVSLSPDGSRLYGAGPGGRTHTWILDESAAVTALEQSAGDPITPAEWDTYVPTIPYPTL